MLKTADNRTRSFSEILLKFISKIGTEYLERGDVVYGFGEPIKYGVFSSARRSYGTCRHARKTTGVFVKWVLTLWMVTAASCSEESTAKKSDSEAKTFDQSEIDANKSGESGIDATLEPNGTDGSDASIEGFDNRTPVIPQVTEVGGIGNITTYGSITDPEPRKGGACNYGETQILNFAAIHLNLNPGDRMGQWNGGRVCGQCLEVQVETAEGIKSTVVRIVDKCPDDFCGVDLGGAPARDLMGMRPGRYDGAWQLIPCPTNQAVSDGPPALFVKEGSNQWWAIIQVRNPPAAVISISWRSRSGSGTFAYATEAENFFAVDESVRTTTETVSLTITYDFDIQHTIDIIGQKLTVEGAIYPI